MKIGQILRLGTHSLTAQVATLTWLLVFLGTSLSTSELRAGGVLRIAEDRLPRGINPLFHGSLAELRVASLLFTGLYGEDAFRKPVAVLVKAGVVDVSNPAVVKLQLRPGLRWHDGHEVTAMDVKFTVDCLLDPALRGIIASPRSILGATVVQKHEVAITFDHSNPRFEQLLTFPIVPQHRFTAQPLSPQHAFRMAPVGTGPYKLERFDADGSITLSRHIGYALGSPNLARIQIREIRDKQIQVEALRFGNLEAVVRVLPRDLPDLAHSSRIELLPYQTNSWWYVAINQARAPWSQPEVREALAALIDVEALLKPLGGGERITGPFVPSSPFYNHSADVLFDAYQPEKGYDLLKRIGITRDAKLSLVTGAKPVTIRLAIEKALPVAKEVALNLEGQLKRAGFSVTTVWLDATSWEKQVLDARDFDLALSQWSFDRSEVIYEQFHSQGRLNFVNYDNKRVNYLLETVRKTFDPELRKRLNQEAHRLISGDRPYLFLWTLTQYAAFASSVHNVTIDSFSFFGQVHQWTIGGSRPELKSR